VAYLICDVSYKYRYTIPNVIFVVYSKSKCLLKTPANRQLQA